MNRESVKILEHLFENLSNAEIEDLLSEVHNLAASRIGKKQTQKIFAYFGSKAFKLDVDANSIVAEYIVAQRFRQKNKSAFLRDLVERNKKLPKTAQRGFGSTDVYSLRRYLDRALKERGAKVEAALRPALALLDKKTTKMS
jgi:hypothetical protein